MIFPRPIILDSQKQVYSFLGYGWKSPGVLSETGILPAWQLLQVAVNATTISNRSVRCSILLDTGHLWMGIVSNTSWIRRPRSWYSGRSWGGIISWIATCWYRRIC
ncbi:hypothetical protein CEXT_120751 [Caerostris extrusa]|uniref:Uncharacterized protein n=1 Tax=Caerostris extrusa TaxID=172846 RepID=A0AAV4PN21_CAEEX|nr:hypothetical protein CEXT_120751 [Caerostris extrusa]